MVSIVSYSLTIPNLGSRCANIPAQYPMLVLQRPRHTSEPRRNDDNPGGAILTPRLQAKICSDCHGLTIETRLTIEHVYQCAAFQSLVACASGWEAMAQRDNRCSCKKNERIFLCQTASSSWVLGAFWVYYKMDILKLITQSGFGFCKLLRAPRSQFFVYKLGPKWWLKTAFENYLDEKNKFNPVLTPFRHSFCSEEAYPRPGLSRESFQATHFVDSGPAFCREKYRGHY